MPGKIKPLRQTIIKHILRVSRTPITIIQLKKPKQGLEGVYQYVIFSGGGGRCGVYYRMNEFGGQEINSAKKKVIKCRFTHLLALNGVV